MSRENAVLNATSLLSGFCGRRDGGTLLACEHDHSGDAEALVRSVEQFAFPDLLAGLRQAFEDNDDMSPADVLRAKEQELEARAQHIEPR